MRSWPSSFLSFKEAARYLVRLAVVWLALVSTDILHAADSFNSAYLSEFLVENRSGPTNDEGGRSGWIELHNGGTATVNLNGWFLTDTPTNLTKWRFPNVAILPDKYLVVFASARDRATDSAALHANFRLPGKAGYVALVNPATNVVSEFAYWPKQTPDVSFGRVRGERSIQGPFQRPTPGKPNMADGPGFAGEITFSRSAGNFTESFTLELSCRTKGAVIHYTLDGALPSTNSFQYSGPLPITNTAHVRARAYQPSLLPGPPASAAYLRLFTNVTGFSSDLPLLILDTLGRDELVTARGSFVHLSLHEPVNARASLTNPPTLTTRAGFRVRGSTSAGMPQSGFAVEFLDEFNQERALPLLGMPADSDWILYAPNSYDPVLIHNPFIHQLSRDLGRYSPRTRFVEAFLVRKSGRVRQAHYQGLYVLQEKIKIAKERVNIDRLGAEDLKPPQVTGGYLLKYDRLGPGEVGVFSTGDRGMVYVEPKEQAMLLPQRAAQRAYLLGFLGDFNRALGGPKWKDPLAGYRAFLDVEAAIDFHVLEVLSGNVDAMVLSTHFHKPRGGRITFGPHWDFDRALGSTDERDANPRHWNTGGFFGGEWWPRLFSDPDFWQLWVDRWQALRETHFSLTNLNALIDRLTDEVREAQPRQYTRWGLQPRGGSYAGEIDHMKRWLAERVDFIDGQLTAPPRLSQAGGRVAPGFQLTLTTPSRSTNAAIYFTLDGSDPRLPQGLISSNAVRYTNPIPLTATVRVMARAHDPNQRQTGGPPVSTPWSRPVPARFDVAAP